MKTPLKVVVSFKEKKQRTVDRDSVVGIVSCCYDDTILSSSLAYHMMSLSSVVQETSRMRYRRRRKDANYTSRQHCCYDCRRRSRIVCI